MSSSSKWEGGERPFQDNSGASKTDDKGTGSKSQPSLNELSVILLSGDNDRSRMTLSEESSIY
jgi:hypothetical protein